MGYLGLLVILVVMAGPVAIAAWLGSRVRRPLIAFFLAWITTPLAAFLLTILMTPALRATAPPGNDGTGVIMIPFFGIVTGLIAGAIVAVVAHRRLKPAG